MPSILYIISLSLAIVAAQLITYYTNCPRYSLQSQVIILPILHFTLPTFIDYACPLTHNYSSIAISKLYLQNITYNVLSSIRHIPKSAYTLTYNYKYLHIQSLPHKLFHLSCTFVSALIITYIFSFIDRQFRCLSSLVLFPIHSLPYCDILDCDKRLKFDDFRCNNLFLLNDCNVLSIMYSLVLLIFNLIKIMITCTQCLFAFFILSYSIKILLHSLIITINNCNQTLYQSLLNSLINHSNLDARRQRIQPSHQLTFLQICLVCITFNSQ